MKKAFYTLLLTVLMPALGYAQKAYEAVQYSGMVQNTRVKFSLANGYPVGSYAVMLNANYIKSKRLHQRQM
ncbi:MAG: hypothetical protein V4592_26945 [Bacteroidota bacterium]